ncbi:MAG: hypothetical protein CMB73_07255 [Euryarchaeota archaeon]|nr:hypothetical protein [Euryarchaeota archaeon]|tara:strand:- start:1189 stop:1809 length:621 start_codon:yes stop_codon:yes gene_type:complete
MKRLLFLVISLIIVSCSVENKEQNIYDDLIGDYWVFLDNEEDIFRESRWDKSKYFFSKSFIQYDTYNQWKTGYLSWSEREGVLDVKYDNEFRWNDSINLSKMEVYKTFIEDSYSLNYTNEIKLINYNTYKVSLKSIDSSGIELEVRDSIKQFYHSTYIRIPHFFPKDPKEFLIEKKLDLELELINQQQYDSIKNRVQKYMDSPLYN